MIVFLAYFSSLFLVYHNWPGPVMMVRPVMNSRVYSCRAQTIHEKLVGRHWAGTYLFDTQSLVCNVHGSRSRDIFLICMKKLSVSISCKELEKRCLLIYIVIFSLSGFPVLCSFPVEYSTVPTVGSVRKVQDTPRNKQFFWLGTTLAPRYCTLSSTGFAEQPSGCREVSTCVSSCVVPQHISSRRAGQC